MMDSYEAIREKAMVAALADKNSALYKALTQSMREAEAMHAKVKEATAHVVIPFQLGDEDVARLEQQFSVPIKVKGTSMRNRLTPLAAGMLFLLDAALMEHASGAGRSILFVDGDISSVMATGADGKIVERTRATTRLAAGYFMEDQQLMNFAGSKCEKFSTAAVALKCELAAGGGDHYWPSVRRDGPRVDSVIINHFRTPVGIRQAAYLAYCRGATGYGAIPFQVDMLTAKEGRLHCFPGKFYVDRDCDTITLVPESDATMSISHPYSALMEFVTNNSVTVCGQEYLCEKYKSVQGILYYSLRHVKCDDETPETLRTWIYNTEALGVTTIKFPKVKMSDEGIPVGVERATVRILTNRVEKVMSRVMTSTSAVITPVEVFTALMDYNNLVINTLDTATVADRMSVEEEEDVALALALHINWQRHAAKGTFKVLLNALKTKFEVADMSLIGMAMVAMSAWWSKPSFGKMGNVDEIPVPDVVDWCGNDFSVVIEQCDPWIEIQREVGRKVESLGRLYEWMPVPPVERPSNWYEIILNRAAGVVRAVEVAEDVISKEKKKLPVLLKKQYLGVVSPPKVSTGVCVEHSKVYVSSPDIQLTDFKGNLLMKLKKDQGAAVEIPPDACLEIRGQMISATDMAVPFVEVDPVSSIAADVLMANGGPFNRDAHKTGYRIAELDVNVRTEGSLVINDSKRLIPKGRMVRLPKVDAGVEGTRVSSQAGLLGAVLKRNVGIPSNRGVVDLDLLPDASVRRVIDVCYREDWKEIVNKHLNTGMWQPNEADIEVFLTKIDQTKAKKLLDEFFIEGQVALDRWLLMAKGKVKSAREPGSEHTVDHSQTIMFLDDQSTNAIYSAMTARFKTCVDECLRPNVKLNAQESDEIHEEWYNSLNSERLARGQTFSYSTDIKRFDRSQEHPALRTELRFYAVHGLSKERYDIWEQTHGAKRATAMMYGVMVTMVLGGVSGLWKTLLRNGLVTLASLIVSTNLQRSEVVTLDVKGDDVDLEVTRPIQVESVVERMSLSFNLSSKFFTNEVRYMCKQFRIKLNGRWFFVADPWSRVQSLCTPIIVGSTTVNMEERWISMKADLRHYDNGILIDRAAEACAQYYGLKFVPFGMARGLAAVVADKQKFYNFFNSPVLVD